MSNNAINKSVIATCMDKVENVKKLMISLDKIKEIKDTTYKLNTLERLFNIYQENHGKRKDEIYFTDIGNFLENYEILLNHISKIVGSKDGANKNNTKEFMENLKNYNDMFNLEIKKLQSLIRTHLRARYKEDEDDDDFLRPVRVTDPALLTKMTYSDKGKFEGMVKKGFYYCNLTTIKKGVIKDGNRTGFGMYEYPKGGKYIGLWKVGQKDGIGIYYYPDGSKYKGEWEKNKSHGKGVDIFPNGVKYVGEFFEGKRKGKGICFYQDGGVYIGNWNNDKKEGRGVQFLPDDSVYEGYFQGDLMHGEGHFFYPNGERYEGEWTSGKKAGKGVQYFRDRSRYDGEWKDDHMLDEKKKEASKEEDMLMPLPECIDHLKSFFELFKFRPAKEEGLFYQLCEEQFVDSEIYKQYSSKFLRLQFPEETWENVLEFFKGKDFIVFEEIRVRSPHQHFFMNYLFWMKKNIELVNEDLYLVEEEEDKQKYKAVLANLGVLLEKKKELFSLFDFFLELKARKSSEAVDYMYLIHEQLIPIMASDRLEFYHIKSLFFNTFYFLGSGHVSKIDFNHLSDHIEKILTYSSFKTISALLRQKYLKFTDKDIWPIVRGHVEYLKDHAFLLYFGNFIEYTTTTRNLSLFVNSSFMNKDIPHYNDFFLILCFFFELAHIIKMKELTDGNKYFSSSTDSQEGPGYFFEKKNFGGIVDLRKLQCNHWVLIEYLSKLKEAKSEADFVMAKVLLKDYVMDETEVKELWESQQGVHFVSPFKKKKAVEKEMASPKKRKIKFTVMIKN